MNCRQLKETFMDKVDYQIIMSNYNYDYSMELINKNEFCNFEKGSISFNPTDGFCFDINWDGVHSDAVQKFYDLINEKNIEDDELFTSWDTDDFHIINFNYCVCSDKYKFFVLIS